MKCRHRRFTHGRDFTQIHCVLLRCNSTEEKCEGCQYIDKSVVLELDCESPPWIVGQSSQGLGDTITKITKATGVRKIVNKLSEVTGIPCGCEKRRELLNNWWPYRHG